MANNPYSLDDIKNDVFKLLDEYSKNGIVGSADDGFRLDMAQRMPLYINSALRRVYAEHAERKSVSVHMAVPDVFFEKNGFALKAGENLVVNVPSPFFCICCLSATGSAYLMLRNRNGLEMNAEDTYYLPSNGGCSGVLKKILPFTGLDMTCTLYALTDCRIKCFILYDLGSSAEFEENEDVPCFGECALKPPRDFGYITSVSGIDGTVFDKELFSFNGSIITAPDDMCGEYIMEYAVRAPQFNLSLSMPDSIYISPEREGLAILYAALEFCPEENTELYMRLSRSLSELSEAFFKVLPPQRPFERNSFYRRTGTKGLLRSKVAFGGDD